METGSQTLSVTLKNMNPDTVIQGVVCGPHSGLVDPGIAGANTGRAEFATDSLGYSAHASVVSGPDAQGQSGAFAGGSVRYAVRVVAQPGYAGPATVDLEIPIYFDASGSGTASGIGSSFAGTYSSDGSIKEDGAALGTYLYQASGATNGASATFITPTHSVEVDTDYIVQFPLAVQVMAYSGVDPHTSTFGSAQSSGTVRISWDAVIAAGFEDPDLSVEFEMVSGSLGLAPPSVGDAPPLPSEAAVVSSLGGSGALVLSLMICVAAVLGQRGLAPLRT